MVTEFVVGRAEPGGGVGGTTLLLVRRDGGEKRCGLLRAVRAGTSMTVWCCEPVKELDGGVVFGTDECGHLGSEEPGEARERNCYLRSTRLP